MHFFEAGIGDPHDRALYAGGRSRPGPRRPPPGRAYAGLVRAVVFDMADPAFPASFVDLPEPTLPGPEWARVEVTTGASVAAISICSPTTPGRHPPSPPLGHSLSCWVMRSRAGDRRGNCLPVAPGTRVAVDPCIPCLPRGIDCPGSTSASAPRCCCRAMGEAGADVVGVDWRTPLDQAAPSIGPGRAVQGNLDPALLFAGWPVIEREARRVLDEGRATPGHVFNLGHGVLPGDRPRGAHPAGRPGPRGLDALTRTPVAAGRRDLGG